MSYYGLNTVRTLKMPSIYFDAYAPLLRVNGLSPLADLSDDVITGEIPGNPGAVPLCDVTIGDWASSSVSSNFLVGWTIQPRRVGPAWSKLCVLRAGNFEASLWNGVRLDSDTLAAAVHLEDGQSAAARCGYGSIPPFQAGGDVINLTVLPPFSCF